MAYNHNPLRVGFIGWGAINRRVASLLAERQREKGDQTGLALHTAGGASSHSLVSPSNVHTNPSAHVPKHSSPLPGCGLQKPAGQ